MERWRETYDAWKLQGPPEAGSCYGCGGPIEGADEDGWECEECGYVLEPEPEYEPADAYDLDDPKRYMA